MKSPPTLALALLALTTIGGAALAWHQYQELVELRAAAMNQDERAGLQKKIWDLEKANRHLTGQLAAAHPDDLDPMIANAPAPRDDGRGPGGPRGRGGNFPGPQAIRDLMAKPEVQAMLDQQRKAQLEQRYAALLHSLNLSPDQAQKLESLLAERQTTMQDVLAAARDQGIDPRTDRDAFRKLVTDAQNQVDDGIKSLLGDSGYAQLQNYEQTQPQRNVVNELQSRLTATDTPLSSAQAEQLVQILAANSPTRPATAGAAPEPGGGRGGFDGGMGGGPGGDMGALAGAFFGGGAGAGPTAPITSGAINQAQSVLSQPQVTALQQLQQQQQNQQQLRQLINDALSSGQPARGGRGGG